jgi:hypothetical protein
MQLYPYCVSQSSEFCRHNPLCCFSTSGCCCCCCWFRYDSVRKLLDTPSHVATVFILPILLLLLLLLLWDPKYCENGAWRAAFRPVLILLSLSKPSSVTKFPWFSIISIFKRKYYLAITAARWWHTFLSLIFRNTESTPEGPSFLNKVSRT